MGLKHAKSLYPRLPVGARTWAASAYGYYLRYWRYGAHTQRLVREALARDAWSTPEWTTWQGERLPDLLDHAATRVPFYREYWHQRRLAGDDASWLELSNWPILEKDSLRLQPGAFLADGVDRRRLIDFHTSGTSGVPITTWRSRPTNQIWYALVEARKRRWYGIDPHGRWAILGAQQVVPVAQTNPPFWVWNAGLRQLYLSAYHIGPRNVAAYLDALRRHRVESILGYPSSLYAIARMARDAGLTAPKVRVVVTNAEQLLPHQRRLIGETFGCPVRDTYGMVEIVAAASECEHGTLHAWPDAGIIEVVDDDAGVAVAAGEVGQFVCTGFLNRDMPLIRYRLGDRGALRTAEDARCACGRRLPVIDRLVGRVSDSVTTADGRRLFALATAFDGLPVHERQTVQHEIDRFEVSIVPDGVFGEEHASLVVERMREMLGDVRVAVRVVDAVPKGPNGKTMTTVSHVVWEPPVADRTRTGAAS